MALSTIGKAKGYTMKMISKLFVLCGIVALVSACSHPTILVGRGFRSSDKTAKVMIKKSGEKTKGGDLFDTYARVCSLDSSDKEADCKDTKILNNVAPGSVY